MTRPSLGGGGKATSRQGAATLGRNVAQFMATRYFQPVG
jgi:hypothetical protein